jgi:hypothetical protein
MKILVLNSGSSSLKYQLFDMPNESPMCSGLVDRIGLENSTLTHKLYLHGTEEIFKLQQEIKDHEAGLLAVTALLIDPEKGVLSDMSEVKAIGHRVVHGGEQFASTTLITAEVKNKIEELFALAPLHNPPNFLGITVAERVFPWPSRLLFLILLSTKACPQGHTDPQFPRRCTRNWESVLMDFMAAAINMFPEKPMNTSTSQTPKSLPSTLVMAAA